MVRLALVADTVVMALGTLRANKMRSALTVLGIVIGITSIVGMTALIRGFDESLRDMFREIGPDTIIVARFSGISVMGGADFRELLKRPNLTVNDVRALAASPSLDSVAISIGGGVSERLFYRGERTRNVSIIGTSREFAEINFLKLQGGRFFNEAEVQHRREVVVLGLAPAEALFPNADPLDKLVRIGNSQYRVIGVLGKRPSPGGFESGQDDVAFIPHTTYQKRFGVRASRMRGGGSLPITIMLLPREGVSRADAMREVEGIMRARHGLKLHEPNDFDIVTQDAALKMWDQISQATFLALVVISSIALMVGGIGVMAIMMISVTERTREIGLRKSLGARRREILWQFLLEAVVLTSIGGVLGIVLGSSIGLSVHWLSGFPVSLPIWAFALGLGFSASVGIFFGLYPAIKASRLDPIEALRYE